MNKINYPTTNLEKVVLRNVSMKDLDFLYRLNTHPLIRKVSHNKKTFSFDEHTKYWEERLLGENFEVFEARIIVFDGVDIGLVRRIGKQISIAIFPGFQGNGIGTEVLKRFCKEGDMAEILENNLRSERVFEKAGFKKEYSVWKR